MILTNTNITREVYFNNLLGCDMVCSTALNKANGSVNGVVVLVVIEHPQGWIMESMRFHKTNVVSCDIVSIDKRNPLVRSYPPFPIYSISPI